MTDGRSGRCEWVGVGERKDAQSLRWVACACASWSSWPRARARELSCPASGRAAAAACNVNKDTTSAMREFGPARSCLVSRLACLQGRMQDDEGDGLAIPQ